MELGLSLGESPAPETIAGGPARGLGLRLGLGSGRGWGNGGGSEGETEGGTRCSGEPRVQLEFLPLVPIPRHAAAAPLFLPWAPPDHGSNPERRIFDVNCTPVSEEDEEEDGGSSPVAAIGHHLCGGGGSSGGEAEMGSSRSRASDDEENNAMARKKLRLSKEQSAFLEESFKEHNTLNPKQKLALAKRLNLRPRQVEVWFQNRRARTKLKQTEVDCEYLKRCCESLTEENRRLHKELAELRALKAASHPFFPQLPATTLSMCPSCERVSQHNNSNPNTSIPNPNSGSGKASPFINARPRFFPFLSHPEPPHQSSAAS